MNINVLYQSRGGNTKKLAQAIAAEAGVSPEPVTKGFRGNTDLLFVGGALYAGKMEKSLQTFMEELPTASVKQVAIFGTATSDNNIGEHALPILAARGINVIGEFYCRGQFLMMNRKRPNEQDLKNGSKFAREMIALAGQQQAPDIATLRDGESGNEHD